MLGARDLPLLTVFAAVARKGSFTAAARELGISKSVVSANVKQLEERCSARLIDRSTRRLRVTEAGAAVLGSAESVAAALSDLSLELDRQRSSPSGTLRVASTHDLGLLLVAPTAATLVKRHTSLRVEVVTDDTQQDLIEGRFDIAVRLGTPRDSAYTMKRLAKFCEPIVAAPELAKAWRHATRPRDLQGAPWVRHSLISGSTMTFTGPRGQRDYVAVSLRSEANTGAGVRALLLDGAGIGVLPEYQLARDLASGALVRLCPNWVWKHVTLYALWPTGRTPRPTVALFLSELQAQVKRAIGPAS